MVMKRRAFIGFIFLISALLLWKSQSVTGAEVPVAAKGPEIMNQKNDQQLAVFAGGCFWGVEELFRKLPGVIETKVGYTGGFVDKPRYDQVKTGKTGHAESIEIRYEPKLISYEKLVTYFFKLHDPTTVNRQGNDIGTQYRSAIFFLNEEQKRVAENIKSKVEKSGAWKKPIVTEIVEASEFYAAEAEHQDYLQRYPQGYTCHYVRDVEF